MTKYNDLTGKIFGRLTVISREANTKDGKARWKCLCNCGNYTIVVGSNMINNNIKSCGCLSKELLKERSTVHGLRGCDEYYIWASMKNRCYNPNYEFYIHYGKRGIYVCDEWKDSFEQFFNDMGARPSKNHSLDRINNNIHYCKSNCRWATKTEQVRNRRNTVRLTYNNESKTIDEWAQIYSINRDTLKRRIFTYKWSIEDALIKPLYSRIK